MSLLSINRTRFSFAIKTVLASLCITSQLTIATPLPTKQDEQVYLDAINHSERSAADKRKDHNRKPHLILPFSQIKRGDKVLELGAGSGHTTELLARVVGQNGKIYAQGLSATRVASGRLPNVIALRRHLLYELADVLDENNVPAASLDSIVIFFALHDFYLNSRIDQQGLLATLYERLKPDGKLIILDNAANVDAGTQVNRRLHRIGENFVIAELAKSGFVVDKKSQALHNPQDDHTQSWQSFSGKHDRFAIRFKKQQ